MQEQPIRALRNGPMPLYHQLELDLLNRIQAGEFQPGDPLPTEEQICEQYSVSRITVRRALDAMMASGRILKRRGVGTFVSQKTETNVRTVRLRGSLDEFLSNASALELKLISFEKEKAADSICKALEIDEDEEVTRIELVSLLNGDPVIFLAIYFPKLVGDHLSAEDISTGLPVIRIVERKLKFRIVRAIQKIEPDTADSATAKYLDLEEGSPLLRIERTYYAANGVPVEAAILRHHPERYEYLIELNAGPSAVS